MINTMYAPLLESYIAWALPSSAGGMKASKEESIFFFQAAAEVWVSETTPTPGQRAMDETLFCIAAISRAVIQQDLRKCANVGKFHPNTDVISSAYSVLKECIYVWLKDSIANWPMEDSFVEVSDIKKENNDGVESKWIIMHRLSTFGACGPRLGDLETLHEVKQMITPNQLMKDGDFTLRITSCSTIG
jgi:hypothetical protein